MTNPILKQEELDLLRHSCNSSDRVFVVGGAVRDWMLGLICNDLDVVVRGDVFSFAKSFANKTNAEYYLMDEEHKVIRVLCHHGGKNMIFDFSQMRGESLEDDLRDRDFTMNAMAVGLDAPSDIIDPLNGCHDLRRKVLRACSKTSMIDDPIRILRAVRFSCQFGLRIGKELSDQIRNLSVLLNQVSGERKRDELIHIFDLDITSKALLISEKYGLLDILLPELKTLQGIEQSYPHTMDVWFHTISTLEWGEKILSALKSRPNETELPVAAIYQSLEPFIPPLCAVLDRPVQEGRSRLSLLKLGMVFHDIAKPETRSVGDDGRFHFYGHHMSGMENIIQIGKKLVLSNSEIDYLGILVRNHMLIHWLCKEGGHLTKKAIYRYFARTHEFGIDICILSLADLLAKSSVTILEEKLQCELIAISELFETWFNHYDEGVAPPLLLDGHEIMALLSIGSNPEVGELLEALKEEQAAGEITDKLEAVAFVQKIYAQMKTKRN